MGCANSKRLSAANAAPSNPTMSVGQETSTSDDYNATDDFARSIDEAYRVIRERKANGGPGWGGWE